MNYNFEWDPLKAASNLKKHGVSFKEAAEVLVYHEQQIIIRIISARRATRHEQRQYKET